MTTRSGRPTGDGGARGQSSAFLSAGRRHLDRALGAYLGFAIGDALGATVEFLTPGEIASEYGVHARMIGGGWLKLKPGQVTDDTEMALCVGRAISTRAAGTSRLSATSSPRG